MPAGSAKSPDQSVFPAPAAGNEYFHFFSTLDLPE
jgi:hypothetical protein